MLLRLRTEMPSLLGQLTETRFEILWERDVLLKLWCWGNDRPPTRGEQGGGGGGLLRT
jgi:hypothetical protein